MYIYIYINEDDYILSIIRRLYFIVKYRQIFGNFSFGNNLALRARRIVREIVDCPMLQF